VWPSTKRLPSQCKESTFFLRLPKPISYIQPYMWDQCIAYLFIYLFIYLFSIFSRLLWFSPSSLFYLLPATPHVAARPPQQLHPLVIAPTLILALHDEVRWGLTTGVMIRNPNPLMRGELVALEGGAGGGGINGGGHKHLTAWLPLCPRPLACPRYI
jgi:hypothetical protein